MRTMLRVIEHAHDYEKRTGRRPSMVYVGADVWARIQREAETIAAMTTHWSTSTPSPWVRLDGVNIAPSALLPADTIVFGSDDPLAPPSLPLRLADVNATHATKEDGDG